MTSCPLRQDDTGRQGPGNTNPDVDKLRVRHNERSSLNRTVSGNGVMRAHQTQPKADTSGSKWALANKIKEGSKAGDWTF